MFWNRRHSAIVVKAPVAVLVGLSSLNISLTTCLSVKGPLDADLLCFLGNKGALKDSLV